ncbi:MAG: 3-oxoacyl-ACP reductase FabG [Gammaproteobacteria bacterium]
MSDRIALVTGASRGIGAAIAQTLARQGQFVVGTATTEAGAAHITAALAEQGLAGRGLLMQVDRTESVETALAGLAAEGRFPTVLVNNAGVTRDNLLLRMREEEWETVIGVNLGSMYRVSKACLRAMLKARFGRIVNITSVVGYSGNAGQCNYAAAKAGIVGFTKALARELAARGITVNAVAPGFIDTDMTRGLTEDQRAELLHNIPLKRLGGVEEVAAAVAFLVSPDAAYITGQTLHVNGGLHMA